MRIEAYNAVSQIYQTNKATGVKRGSEAYTQSDKIEFSDVAKTYQTAKAAVAAAPDVRADKIAEIKAQMAAGTYNISSQLVADKLVSNLGGIVF